MSSLAVETNEELLPKLLKIGQDQLLIRMVLSADRKGVGLIHFRADLVLIVRSVKTDLGSAFAHLTFQNDPRKDFCGLELTVQDLQFENEDYDFTERLRSVLKHWRNGVTGDGPRPHDEWFVPKPFVGILTCGMRPGTVVTETRPDDRIWPVYYGSILHELDKFQDELFAIGKRDSDLPAPYQKALRVTENRFKAFAGQVQTAQIQRIIE